MFKQYWLKVSFVLLLCSHSFSGISQEYTIEEVKAALLVQVVKNLSWPSEQNRQSLTISVWDDQAVFNSLKYIENSQVRGMLLKVADVNRLESLINTDIIYIPFDQLDQLSAIASAMRGTQTLIVTENSASLHNVMINLLVEENASTETRLQFQINRPNIIYEGLTIQPDLVLYGGSEIDVAELYYQTERAITKLREDNASTYQQLSQQQALLESKTIEFNQVQASFVAKEQEFLKLEKQLTDLTKLLEQRQSLLQQNKQRLDSLNQQVDKVDKQFLNAKALAEQKQNELQDAEQALASFKLRVDEQLTLLTKLKAETEISKDLLETQKNQLIAAETEAKFQSELIDRQRDIIIIVLIVVAIGFVAIFTIVKLFLKNKRVRSELESALSTLTEAQQQLVESEKMASLGELVTGVAHEINTPIGIALTAMSTLGAEAKDFKELIEEGRLKRSDATRFSEKLIELDALVEGNLQRCHKLVENFKQVSADQVVEESRPTHLKEYCESIFTTFSAFMRDKRIRNEVNGDNPVHVIDPGILSQVLGNLITNSANHGFEGVENRKITIDIEATEQGTKLIFNDNGIGMSDKVRQKLFDPFFTTKRAQGGTGLGMNIVYTLVTTKLRGQITVESEEGKGSTFIISLPV